MAVQVDPLDRPAHERLEKGHAPPDGDCFFHSLRNVAGPLIARTLGRHPAEVHPWDIRRHTTLVAIARLQEFNRNPSRQAELLDQRRHLVQFMEDKKNPLRPPVSDEALAGVLRIDVERVRGLSDDQRENLLDFGRDKAFAHNAADLFPPAAVDAFPGLRLFVVDPRVTPRHQDNYMFGSGDGKQHVLFLDRMHYSPAEWKA